MLIKPQEIPHILKLLLTKEGREQLEAEYEPKVEAWLKENQITEKSGTWLHKIAPKLHKIARLTALTYPFRGRVYQKQNILADELKARLKEKLELYVDLMEKHQDQDGMIIHHHCDSTLFSGLVSGAKLKKPVRLEAARDPEGFWHRRSLIHPECWQPGNGSTISRDMMWGVAWYCWYHKNLDLALSTYEHIKKHNYVMGLGDPARLVMMPALEAVFANMIEALGGPKQGLAKYMSSTWPKSLTSYQVHLLMLNALILGEIQGWIPKAAFKAIEAYAKRYPRNPLFQYAYHKYTDGEMYHAAYGLLDDSVWPDDRLPRRSDRHSDWVIQRTKESDWAPNTKDQDEEYTGGDYIFVTNLILNH